MELLGGRVGSARRQPLPAGAARAVQGAGLEPRLSSSVLAQLPGAESSENVRKWGMKLLRAFSTAGDMSGVVRLWFPWLIPVTLQRGTAPAPTNRQRGAQSTGCSQQRCLCSVHAGTALWEAACPSHGTA